VNVAASHGERYALPLAMRVHPEVIVIGGSAGAIDALLRIMAALPAVLHARVFITVHVPSTAVSALPAILTRAGPIAARHPTDGERTQPSVIYVAPPDYHLLVKRDTLRIVRGPRENGHRPAIDPLFRSAAASYGARVIGVVLSGNLDDGAAGAAAIAAAGGTVIVQDPEDSPYPSMPLHARARVPAAVALPLDQIAGHLIRLLATTVEEAPPMTHDSHDSARLDPVELDPGASEAFTKQGESSGLTCPECHGGIFEINTNGAVQYRCRTGHAFTGESLFAEQRASVEAALWTALRSLEESAELANRLAERAQGRSNDRAAGSYRRNAAMYWERAGVIREVLENGLMRSGESELSQDTVTG
jgi:two-component system chemotaxis response regulator CheB